jgi:glycosyltransferase involved in cell wall biosynthesis
VPVVLMSESTEHDAPRSRWKEWLKGQILALCSGALVGGSAHIRYLIRLGMPPGQIFEGYDVVDNDYFRRATATVRQHSGALRAEFGLPQQYFLASARFIERKNLSRLLEAYGRYRGRFAAHEANRHSKHEPWSLVLLGDGPEKGAIERLISGQGLQSSVRLPGFRQYSELPVYYGLANAFVHASTSEPWGLVVNEAMASGLPVLVSNRCGCVPDLVRECWNGFTFDPGNVEQLARLMFRLSSVGPQLARMSRASVEMISNWAPSRFANGLRASAENAVKSKLQMRALWQNGLF